MLARTCGVCCIVMRGLDVLLLEVRQSGLKHFDKMVYALLVARVTISVVHRTVPPEGRASCCSS